MADTMVVIITGANRGIGKAIVETLAKGNINPLTIYATSRKGRDLGLQTSPGVKIKYSTLDIVNQSSVDDFAKSIRKAHSSMDVLINNAAAHDSGNYTPENVERVLDTNVRGTLRISQAFIPILRRKTGRIVNISSIASTLSHYPLETQHRFRNPKTTLQDIEQLLLEYQTSVQAGSEMQNGWPKSAYSVSKASTNALTAVLARDNPDLIINCCCPGWVATDMGSIAGGRPPKSPEDGARIPVRLGFGDVGGWSGRYWANASVAGVGEGEVMDW